MTPEQKQAYDWAKNQNYTSVAAQYAKVLAGLVDELQDELEDAKCCANIARNDYKSVRERNRELQAENEQLRKESES